MKIYCNKNKKNEPVKAGFYLTRQNSEDGKRTFSYEVSDKELCFGVPGAYFIWKGNTADPWVEWKGEVYFYPDIEEMMYHEYEAWCEYESGEIPSDSGFDDYLQNYVSADAFENAAYDLTPFAKVIETSGNYHWAKEL